MYDYSSLTYSISDQLIDHTQFDVYATASLNAKNITITASIIGQSHFFTCNIHNNIYSELVAGKNKSLPYAHTVITQQDFCTPHTHSITIPHYTSTTRFLEQTHQPFSDHTTISVLNKSKERLTSNSISLSHTFPPSGTYPPGTTYIYAEISGQDIASICLKTIHEYPEQSYTLISNTHILYIH